MGVLKQHKSLREFTGFNGRSLLLAALFLIICSMHIYAVPSFQNVTVNPSVVAPGQQITITFEFMPSPWVGMRYLAGIADTSAFKNMGDAGQQILVWEGGIDVLTTSVTNGRAWTGNDGGTPVWHPSSEIDPVIVMTVPAGWADGTYYVLIGGADSGFWWSGGTYPGAAQISAPFTVSNGPTATATATETETPTEILLGNNFVVSFSSYVPIDDNVKKISYRFTADHDYKVDKIHIQASSPVGSPSFTVGIQGNTGPNEPDGSFLTSASQVFVNDWNIIDVPDFTLIAGNVYHVVIQGNGLSAQSANFDLINSTTGLVPRVQKSDPMFSRMFDAGAGWNVQSGEGVYVLEAVGGVHFGNPYDGSNGRTIDLEDTPGDTSDDDMAAQFITGPDAITKVAGVKGYIKKVGNPTGNVMFALYNLSENITITAGVLADAASIGTSFAWISAACSVATMEPGKNYRLLFYAEGGSSGAGNYFVINDALAGGTVVQKETTYAGTKQYMEQTSSGHSGWSASTNGDLNFELIPADQDPPTQTETETLTATETETYTQTGTPTETATETATVITPQGDGIMIQNLVVNPQNPAADTDVTVTFNIRCNALQPGYFVVGISDKSTFNSGEICHYNFLATEKGIYKGQTQYYLDSNPVVTTGLATTDVQGPSSGISIGTNTAWRPVEMVVHIPPEITGSQYIAVWGKTGGSLIGQCGSTTPNITSSGYYPIDISGSPNIKANLLICNSSSSSSEMRVGFRVENHGESGIPINKFAWNYYLYELQNLLILQTTYSVQAYFQGGGNFGSINNITNSASYSSESFVDCGSSRTYNKIFRFDMSNATDSSNIAYFIPPGGGYINSLDPAPYFRAADSQPRDASNDYSNVEDTAVCPASVDYKQIPLYYDGKHLLEYTDADTVDINSGEEPCGIVPSPTPHHYVARKASGIFHKINRPGTNLNVTEAGRMSPNGDAIIIYSFFGNSAEDAAYITTLQANPEFYSVSDIGSDETHSDYKYVTGTAGW